jgi:hypothetical protein
MKFGDLAIFAKVGWDILENRVKCPEIHENESHLRFIFVAPLPATTGLGCWCAEIPPGRLCSAHAPPRPVFLAQCARPLWCARPSARTSSPLRRASGCCRAEIPPGRLCSAHAPLPSRCAPRTRVQRAALLCVLLLRLPRFRPVPAPRRRWDRPQRGGRPQPRPRATRQEHFRRRHASKRAQPPPRPQLPLRPRRRTSTNRTFLLS